MKTYFRSLPTVLAAICVLAAGAAHAQTFPNGTLDTWVTRNNIEAPTNWLVTNDILPLVLPLPGLSVNNVTKSADARTGPFAAQLQTNAVTFLGQTGTVPAFLFLGTRLTDNADLPGGLPFTARPARMQFAYKLTGPNALNDSAVVAVQLTRTTGRTVTVVAEAIIERLAPVAAYTLQSLSLKYLSNAQPDTVRIIFLSGAADRITAGTTLQVDDVTFTGTVTATRDAALNATFTAAPNPSPDGRFVLRGLAPALLAAPLTVLDATGRVVRRDAIIPAAVAARNLDLSALPAGVYTVQLLTTDGLVTRKLVR